MTRLCVSADTVSAMGAPGGKVTDRVGCPDVANASDGPQTGLLSRAKGVIFADRGAVGDLPFILAPLTSQGASFMLADPRIPEPELKTLLEFLRDDGAGVGFLIHCALPADTGPRGAPYFETDLLAFQAAMACCVHGFAALARCAADVMAPGGSLLSLNWPVTGTTGPRDGLSEVIRAAQAASVRCLAEDLGPRGIRVNAIAAGPVCARSSGHRTSRHALPMSGRHRAPLRRDVTSEEIGKAAVFLLSELSSGTTGTTLHVDAGHHVIGLRGVAPQRPVPETLPNETHA